MTKEELLALEIEREQAKLKKYLAEKATISFKISSILRDEFKEACNFNNSDMKSELLKFIKGYIEESHKEKEKNMEKLKKEMEIIVDEFISKANSSETELVKARISQANPTPVGIENWRMNLLDIFSKMGISAPILILDRENLEAEYKTSYEMLYTMFNMELINAIVNKK